MINCVLSCILDIAIYKKRSLVDIIIYMELLHLTLLTMIPSPNNSYTDLYQTAVHFFFFTAFYTNKGGHIISMLVSDIIQRFLILPIIFKIPLTFGAVVAKMTQTIGLFCMILCLAVILKYISELHVRMKTTNSENIRLLDGMHEGLLILDKASKGIMFFNRPAQKIFNGAINKLSLTYTKDGQMNNPLL